MRVDLVCDHLPERDANHVCEVLRRLFGIRVRRRHDSRVRVRDNRMHTIDAADARLVLTERRLHAEFLIIESKTFDTLNAPHMANASASFAAVLPLKRTLGETDLIGREFFVVDNESLRHRVVLMNREDSSARFVVRFNRCRCEHDRRPSRVTERRIYPKSADVYDVVLRYFPRIRTVVVVICPDVSVLIEYRREVRIRVRTEFDHRPGVVAELVVIHITTDAEVRHRSRHAQTPRRTGEQLTYRVIVHELFVLTYGEVRLRHRERVRLCTSLRDRVLLPQTVRLCEVRHRRERVFRVLK